jgi:hypothetical protein
MVEALGMQVVGLHRASFAGIGLRGLQEGTWLQLDEKEMTIIRDALKKSGGRVAHAHTETQRSGEENDENSMDFYDDDGSATA